MPQLLSLTRAGVLNASRVRAAAEEVVADDGTGAIQEFLQLARNSTFSTNVDASKIDAFDVHDAVLDTRAVGMHQAGGDEDLGLQAFDAEQGTWLVRRKAFEGLWRHGSRFVYGAVNAGGMGVERPRFGPFCLVVSDPAANADAIAVFPSDSAQRYTSDTGDVDRERARREAAPWHHRGPATTIERADDVKATLRPAWPWLICSPQRYVEVVVAPGPPLASVDAVRVRDAYLAHLEDLKLVGVDVDVDPSVELRELMAFEALNRWRTAHDIDIESVG